MATNIEQAWESGDIGRDRCSFEVLCVGTEDPAQAFLEVYSQVPPSYNNGVFNLILNGASMRTKRVARDAWAVPVEYIREDLLSQQDDPGSYASEVDWGFDFEIGGGTAHITQSLETIGKYAAPGQTAPDFKGAIGVTKDSVEGADVPVRSFGFSITQTYLSEQVTPSFINNIYSLSCCVNSGAFMYWQSGEVLFLAATGSNKGQGTTTINFKFAAAPNKSNFNVGDIVGISKQGHDLLWIRYADVEDTTAHCVVKRPQAAYIERVIERGNLNLLPVLQAA